MRATSRGPAELGRAIARLVEARRQHAVWLCECSGVGHLAAEVAAEARHDLPFALVEQAKAPPGCAARSPRLGSAARTLELERREERGSRPSSALPASAVRCRRPPQSLPGTPVPEPLRSERATGEVATTLAPGGILTEDEQSQCRRSSSIVGVAYAARGCRGRSAPRRGRPTMRPARDRVGGRRCRRARASLASGRCNRTRSVMDPQQLHVSMTAFGRKFSRFYSFLHRPIGVGYFSDRTSRRKRGSTIRSPDSARSGQRLDHVLGFGSRARSRRDDARAPVIQRYQRPSLPSAGRPDVSGRQRRCRRCSATRRREHQRVIRIAGPGDSTSRSDRLGCCRRRRADGHGGINAER